MRTRSLKWAEEEKQNNKQTKTTRADHMYDGKCPLCTKISLMGPDLSPLPSLLCALGDTQLRVWNHFARASERSGVPFAEEQNFSETLLYNTGGCDRRSCALSPCSASGDSEGWQTVLRSAQLGQSKIGMCARCGVHTGEGSELGSGSRQRMRRPWGQRSHREGTWLCWMVHQTCSG